MEDHEDVHLFRRFRRCAVCEVWFETAEVEEKFLRELIELRMALADIKLNAAEYQLDARKAAEKLRRLSKSLAVLEALE